MRTHTSLLALSLPLFLLPAASAQSPYKDPNYQYIEGAKSCGTQNSSNPPKPPKKCPDDSPESGSDASSDSRSAGTPALGPSAHIASQPPTGSIELPSVSVIASDHGGALLDTEDLSLPGELSGIPLDFTRYYNSRHADGFGDAMGHGRTWTHSFSWRMTAPGNIRSISFPSGRRLDFTLSGPSTYLGQASTRYIPPAGNGERLHQIGAFWHLVMPGAAAHTFERVVLPDLTVIFPLRESMDTRGNTVTYTTDSSARVTRAADVAGNAMDLTYSQISLNRKDAVALHTVTASPQVGWNEVIIPAGESFRWFQAVSAPGAWFEVSEIQFYQSNGSGGHTLLAGTTYGTSPALNDGPNTYLRAFDGSTSNRFSFCRSNNGIAGIDLGASATAAVTRIRFHIPSAFSNDLDRYVGMRFEAMREELQTLTVLTQVTASTGASVEYEYGSHLDASVGQSHSVLESAVYRNAASQITDQASLTWVTAQDGSSPCVERAREPRSTRATPDIAFDYYPGNLAVKGQPARILTGTPAAPQLIQISDPQRNASYFAPDGGVHSVINTSSSYLPSSSTDAAGKTTFYSWSATRFLASETTPAGTTTYTHNSLGQPQSITHPDGLTETHNYDSLGRLTRTTLSAPGHPSRTTTYTRDADGRITRVTRPDGSYTQYTYNSLGLVTSERLPNGSYTVHTYDPTTGSPTAGLRLTTTTGLATPTATTGGETTTFAWHLPANPSGSPARLLASKTDPRGRTTSYIYDHAGRLTKTTYPDGSFRQLVLDEFGNKQSEFDGTSLEEWTYDDFRRPLVHTNAAGAATTYNYGANGSSCGCYGSGGPTLITSPAGRMTHRTYDLMGRLLTETQGHATPDAATTTHLRDTLGRITSTTGPDGHITTFAYDSQGRPLTSSTLITDHPALITSSTYSPFGDTLTTTAPGSRTTTMAFDKMSRPVTITDPLGTVTTVTYDLGGRRTAVTEAFGTASARTTGFAHDAFDRLLTTTYPDNTTTSQTYHPGGETHTSTDELGLTTTRDTALVTWTDSLNQSWTSFAQTTTDPAGNTTTAYGPPIAFTGGTRRIVSPGGRIAESFIDELGRTTLTRSGLVTTASDLTADVSDTVMTHDPDGLVLTSTTDPTGLNLTTTNIYDALGRTKTTKDPLDRTTGYTYDKRGNLLTTTLPDTRQHTATYDALSRRLTITDPKNQTITYGYWYETSQTLSLKDARNHTTHWTYNLRGQILTKVYPNDDDHAYTYDALGRMETHTTPKNETCTYEYDLRDRQTLANWNSTTPDTAKTYWANGLLKSIDNGVSKSDYLYNNRNLLTSETQTLSGQSARVVSYDYDADGLRSDLQGSAGVSPASYTWTARAQLQTINVGDPPPLATYTYDKAGRNTALAHENGITESKSYDAASQLLANTHLKAGTPVSGHGYTLDSTGRRQAETFADGTTPARDYNYDDADQVTTVDYGSSQTDTYNYDAMGNRTTAAFSRSVGVPPTNGTVNYGTANNANQYTTITGLTPITHDANGNLLQQNNTTRAWDSENRLLSLTPNTPALGDQSLVHTYDGQHRRVTRTIREWTTAGWSTLETTHFIYDGWNVIEEYSIFNNQSTMARTRTWGTDLSSSLQSAGGVGGLLLTEEITGSTTTAHHFHYDGNGNVTEITDLSGSSTASYRYDAFGNTLVSTGTYAAQNRYRFSTKPLDSEVTDAPLYYYGYRYYDPTTGRWPSRDPIEEEGGVNLYAFVGNDVVNEWDFMGLSVNSPQTEWECQQYCIKTCANKGGSYTGHTLRKVTRRIQLPTGTGFNLTTFVCQCKPCGKDGGSCSCNLRCVGKEDPPSTCPKVINAVGKDQADCQSNARANLAENCKKFLGHCQFRKSK